MSTGLVHSAVSAGPQQQMWSAGGGYGSAPVGLAAWVDAHAFPGPPPPPLENEVTAQEGIPVESKVSALEVENCEMAGKMAAMEAVLREREEEAVEMKQQLMAFEHVLEGERRGEPLSKAELLKQVIALSTQLQELSRYKVSTPPMVVGSAEEDPTPPPPASGSTPPPAATPVPAVALLAAAGAPTADTAGPALALGDTLLQQEAAALAPAEGESSLQVQPAELGNPTGPEHQQGQAEASAGGAAAAEGAAGKEAAVPASLGAQAVTGLELVAPPPVRVGKNTEAHLPYQLAPAPEPLQQPLGMAAGWDPQEGFQYPRLLPRSFSRGEYGVPPSPGASAGMMPPYPGFGGMVPAYNRSSQSPGMPEGGLDLLPPGALADAASYSNRPMTSPSPALAYRSAGVGLPRNYSGVSDTVPLGQSASYGGPTTVQPSFNGPRRLTHSMSFGGGVGLNPMTPSAASIAPSAFAGHNVANMNAAELYGGDITASGLSAVRGTLLTFARAKTLQAKEHVLKHLDSMVEHGRVSPDEVVAGVMEKCVERMRHVPLPPKQPGGIFSNLAGKAKFKAAEDEYLKNPVVAEAGMLASTVVAFEWAHSSYFVELLEAVPDLINRRLLTLEFLNGIFARCGKLAVARVIDELPSLDSLVGNGLLPSVRELHNCMVLVMVNTKRSVEWRRKWILGKA